MGDHRAGPRYSPMAQGCRIIFFAGIALTIFVMLVFGGMIVAAAVLAVQGGTP